MSEIIIVYALGLVSYPMIQYMVFPYAKKKIQERWADEEVAVSNKRLGRPKGSKNRPKEEKE